MDLREKMRIIEDFPKEGISYKDITTVLADKEALKESVRILREALKDVDYDYLVGVEARGFIFASMLALAENKGFLMVRKPGKLPGNIISESYSLEYGEATVEIDKDLVPEGSKVVVVDDLLATGGTALASCHLVEKAGGKVVKVQFLTELTGLGGRKVLEDAGFKVGSLLHWEY